MWITSRAYRCHYTKNTPPKQREIFPRFASRAIFFRLRPVFHLRHISWRILENPRGEKYIFLFICNFGPHYFLWRVLGRNRPDFVIFYKDWGSGEEAGERRGRCPRTPARGIQSLWTPTQKGKYRAVVWQSLYLEASTLKHRSCVQNIHIPLCEGSRGMNPPCGDPRGSAPWQRSPSASCVLYIVPGDLRAGNRTRRYADFQRFIFYFFWLLIFRMACYNSVI